MSSPAALPAELWFKIFRFATLSPSIETLYETTHYPFPEMPGPRGCDFGIRAEPSFAAKGYLSLVCKNWNNMAKDYLYEDLIIPTEKRMVLEMKRFLLQTDIDDKRRFNHPPSYTKACSMKRMFLPLCPTSTQRPGNVLCLPRS
ncbi:hypothetical protein QCA50_003327 [Cerrena zonata]|uniref:F-box domain-containing protein n=1 Tax=Cerrena zonata TaxID=2478898 RepID=A0AAW0GRT7_9APHY